MAKISIEKFELFIVLKENNFKISNKTVEDTLSSIQRKFNIFFDEKNIDLKKDMKNQLTIKKRWLKLKGGSCRTIFKEKLKTETTLINILLTNS